MFEPVNDLEKSLVNAATHPSARPQFYRDLLDADIYIVNRGENNPNLPDHGYQPGSELRIQQLKKGDQLVNRAYLAQVHYPENDEKPHLLIGIDAQGDWEKVIGDAGMIASNVLEKGELIDFMRLDDSGISQYLINKTRPFYEKS